MTMNMALVVPVVQTDLARELFQSIMRNYIKPQQVIIIDNSTSGFVCPLRGITTVRHPKAPIDVNPSWSFGFSFLQRDIDIVVVANDDILVNHVFFDKVLDVFERYPNAAYVIPSTIPDKDKIKLIYTRDNPVRRMKIKSGWCFALNKKFLESVPRIPDELETFFGDTWYYLHAVHGKFDRLVMNNNQIYHYGGATLKTGSLLGYRRKRARERLIFNQLIEGALNSWHIPVLT